MATNRAPLGKPQTQGPAAAGPPPGMQAVAPGWGRSAEQAANTFIPQSPSTYGWDNPYANADALNPQRMQRYWNSGAIAAPTWFTQGGIGGNGSAGYDPATLGGAQYGAGNNNLWQQQHPGATFNPPPQPYWLNGQPVNGTLPPGVTGPAPFNPNPAGGGWGTNPGAPGQGAGNRAQNAAQPTYAQVGNWVDDGYGPVSPTYTAPGGRGARSASTAPQGGQNAQQGGGRAWNENVSSSASKGGAAGGGAWNENQASGASKVASGGPPPGTWGADQFNGFTPSTNWGLGGFNGNALFGANSGNMAYWPQQANPVSQAFAAPQNTPSYFSGGMAPSQYMQTFGGLQAGNFGAGNLGGAGVGAGGYQPGSYPRNTYGHAAPGQLGGAPGSPMWNYNRWGAQIQHAGGDPAFDRSMVDLSHGPGGSTATFRDAPGATDQQRQAAQQYIAQFNQQFSKPQAA